MGALELLRAQADVSGLRKLTKVERRRLVSLGCTGDIARVLVATGARGALANIERVDFRGANCLLSPRASVRDSELDDAILGGASVVRSRIIRSAVGDGVTVASWSVVRDSVVASFRRLAQESGGTTRADEHGVSIEESQVSSSLIWGGSDIGPFAYVRQNSIVGPFVHVGAGSEVKSSWLVGASPRHRVEVAHRNYMGDCRALAVHIPGNWGSSEWLAALEETLAVLFRGVWLRETVVGRQHEGVVLPLSEVEFRLEGSVRRLSIEAVNLGALFTTSNFDPRLGGFKMTTEIGAGAKLGVLTWAQAPCVIGEGALVASGSKAARMSAAPNSLVVGGAGEPVVKADFMRGAGGRFGQETLGAAKIACGYIRGTEGGLRATRRVAPEAAAFQRVAWLRQAEILAETRADGLHWLERYGDAVRLSRDAWSSEGADGKARERVAEHGETIGEIDAMLASFRDGSAAEPPSSLAIDDGLFAGVAAGLADGRGRPAFCAVAVDDLGVRWADVRRGVDVAERLLARRTTSRAGAAPLEGRAATSAPRLFGTSGIRGRVAEASDAPVVDFEKHGLVTPELAYDVAAAFARVLARRDEAREVVLLHDVRESSVPLAAAAAQGFADEGGVVHWGGVAATPATTALGQGPGGRPCMVITASHNPPSENGIKLFLRGQPIDTDIEDEIESVLRQGGRGTEKRKRRVRREPRAAVAGSVRNDIARVRADLTRMMERELQSTALRGALRGRTVSLDLAHGAAATFRGGDGLEPLLGVGLEAILATGAAVVGYASERDAALTNLAVGAAFPYGESRATLEGVERAVRPCAGEIEAFAAGAHGYGRGEAGEETGTGWRVLRAPVRAAVARSLYFPSGALPEGLSPHATTLPCGQSAVFAADDIPVASATWQAEIAQLGPPVLAAAVDCDADRLLVTDTETAASGLRFLDGDRLLATLAVALSNVREVVFTCESGLGLAAAIASRGIPAVRTTVGDRAVAAALLRPGARERLAGDGIAIGAEPSGHVLIASLDASGEPRFTDDPFVVILRLLAAMHRTGSTLSRLAKEACRAFDDDVVVRKPEAWGIGLADKPRLTLGAWNGNSVALGHYSRAYIEYMTLAIATLLGEIGLVKNATAIASRPLPTSVRSGEPQTLAVAGDLRVVLEASKEPFRGPDDIMIAVRRRGEPLFEVVSRNSGTSPKNACYFKARLPPSIAPKARVAELLQRLAADRVAFTKGWLSNNS